MQHFDFTYFFQFCAVRSLAQNVCLCVAGVQKYVLYSYVVVDWWSVMQLERERARRN